MDTVPEVCTRARALLNDQEDQTFHDTVLLEYINDAFEEIQEELALRNVPAVQEISATIPVLANTTTTISRIQIPDLFYPMGLSEFPTGSSEAALDMTKLQWDSEMEVGDRILYWNWREGEIKIPQVTQNTSVVVRYNRLYMTLDENDPVQIIGAKRFLARRTAALAAGPIGGRFDLAEFLLAEANAAKDLFLSNNVRQIQKFGVRRRPFRRMYVQ